MKKIYQHLLKLINKKYSFYFIISIIIIFFIIINNTYFQTKIAKHFLFKINQHYHTNILIDNISIDLILGNIKIQKFQILDHKQKILISIPQIEGNINILNLFFQKFHFQNLSINNSQMNIITYKKDSISNIIYFIKSFIIKNTNKKHINNLIINNFKIKNAYIKIINNKYIHNLIFQGNYNYFSKRISFSNKLIKSYISNIILTGKYMNKKIHIHFNIKKFFFSNNKLICLNSNLIFNNSKILNSFLLSYNTYTDLLNYSSNIFFSFIIQKGSYISSHDINFFIKKNYVLTKYIFYIRCQVRGKLNNNINIFNLNIKIGKNILQSQHIILYEKQNNICLSFNKHTFIKTSFFDIKKIFPINKIPVILNSYGTLKYYGSINISSQMVQLYGKLISTTIGIISGNLVIFHFKTLKSIEYQGKLYIKINNISPLLKNKNFKSINGEFIFYGKGYQLKNSKIKLHGIIKNIIIYNKQINNIHINGYLLNNSLYGLIYINDNNINIKFHGKMTIYPNKYFISGKIKFTHHANQSISGKNIQVNLHWITANNFNIYLYLNNIFYKSASKILFIPKINFIYSSVKKQQQFGQLSIPELIKLSFFGKFQWMELSSLLINNLNKLLNNQEYHSVSSNQYLNFKIYITKKFRNIFNNTIQYLSYGKIIGHLSDKQLIIYGQSNRININNYIIKNINITLNTNKKYNLILNIDTISYQGITIKNMNLYTFIKNNFFYMKIYFDLKIYNFLQEVNLNLFKKNYYVNGIKYIFIGLSRSLIKINNNHWWLNQKNQINYNILKSNIINKKLFFNEFKSNQIHQKINFDSKILNTNYNIIQGILKQFLNNNILKSFFVIENKNSKFIFDIKLELCHIYINNLYIGDITIHILYHNQKYKILLNIKNKTKYLLYISGYIKNLFKTKEYINLKIKIYDLPVLCLKEVIKNTFSDIRGICTGMLYLTGYYNHLDYNGYLYLKNIGVKINNINTDYDIIGTALIVFKKKTIFFKNLIIRDTKYNSIGYINGIILHENNKWMLSVYIDAKNLLILDTNELNNKFIYGRIFAKSKIHILGDINNLSININNSKISNDSKLFISTDNHESHSENINFLNKKYQFKNQHFLQQETKKCFFNIESNIDEKCDIQLFFNSKKNNFIKARGVGNILFKTNALGEVEMSGIYYIKHGYYQLNSTNLPQFNKKFKIMKGGTIIWGGVPNNPKLNITAYYFKSVTNIEEYIQIPNYNHNITSKLIINIYGNLYYPKFKFNIDFTDINNNLKQQIIQKLYTREEIITQFGSILLLGKFFIKHQLFKTDFIFFSKNIFKYIVNIFLKNKLNDNNHQNNIQQITYSLIYEIKKYFAIQGIIILPIPKQTSELVHKKFRLNIDVYQKFDNNLKIMLLYHSFYTYKENIYQKVSKILLSNIYGGSIFYIISFDNIKELWQRFLLYK